MPDQQPEKNPPRTGGNRWAVNPRLARSHFRPLARIVFSLEFSFIRLDRPHQALIPARTHLHSQNGRSLRCRPRPQQGPRGLHRQGRQHQLHDGVAAPRQQVSTGFGPRPRFRVFSRFSRRMRRAIVERATRPRAIAPARTNELCRFEGTRARARRPFIPLDVCLFCRPRTRG